MLGKFLGFGHMHENKFFFLNKEIDLKAFRDFFVFFENVLNFFEIFQKKSGILILDLYLTM
jgi:hypothetical protein